MRKILLDINILLDVLFKRDASSIALVERLIESGSELYISSVMVPTLDYFLNKYKADKIRFKEKIFGFLKVITTSGDEAIKACNYRDAEDALIALSFKRVCPDGVIITRDKEFGGFGLELYTPEDYLKALEQGEIKKTIPMLDLQKQYRHMMEDIDGAVLKNITSAKYILGPEVKELEGKIASYLGVKHCIGASSGTEALVLSLRALAIKTRGREYFDRSDEIITTPFTFTATGDAILRAGATPVFVDIDPNTYNIDPAKIKEYLKSAIRNPQSTIRGMIPVHLYGQSCNMDEIMSIANEYNLFVLEDVAQAFGASWKGKKLGSIGDIGAFSFFPSKNLGGFGDGGMVAANDDEIAELVRMLLKHGGKDKYNVDHIGYNARLDTLQAAILLEKLKYIDEFNEKRRQIADIYNKELSGINGLSLPITSHTSHFTDSYHVYHQYTIRVLNGKRDELQKYLKEKGISTMVYYPVALHKMKVFDERCQVNGDLGESEKAVTEVLSLPIEPLMKEGDINYVIENIKDFFKDV